MYHYYNQKQPPTLIEIANAKPLERLFYYASMYVQIEENNERLGANGF